MQVALPQLDADTLTNSRIGVFKRCRRRHLYRYEMGVRPATTPAYFSIGGAYHLGLELFSKGADEPEVYEAVRDRIAPATSEAVADVLLVETMLRLYRWYWSATQNPPNITIAEHVAAEQRFAFTLDDVADARYTVAGKIDGIIRLGDGRLAVLEYKTASDDLSATSDYWRRLLIDEQISLYVLGARRLGYDVKTVLYDVARKPQHELLRATPDDRRRYTAKGALYANQRDRDETPDEYAARIHATITADPAAYFARREIPRLDADLREFEAELREVARDIHDARARGPAASYRSTGACVGFGRCEYLGVCANGISPAAVPDGFVRVDNIHPELLE